MLEKKETVMWKSCLFARLLVIVSLIYGAEDSMLQYVVWNGRDHGPGL